jgi:hypothetical protein
MSDAVVPHRAEPSAPRARAGSGWFKRALDSDIFYSFRRSKLTMVAAAVTHAVLPAGDLCLPSSRCRTRSIRRSFN